MNVQNDQAGSQPKEKDKPQGPQVEFEHVNSLETVKFKADWDTPLKALWEEAYGLLEEPHRAEDRLQDAHGSDLMPYLDLTLRVLRDRKLIRGHHFQIIGPTGGASA